MIAKLDTAMWFLRRPTHWMHAADIARRKWLPYHDGPAEARKLRGGHGGGTGGEIREGVDLQEAIRLALAKPIRMF